LETLQCSPALAFLSQHGTGGTREVNKKPWGNAILLDPHSPEVKYRIWGCGIKQPNQSLQQCATPTSYTHHQTCTVPGHKLNTRVPNDTLSLPQSPCTKTLRHFCCPLVST